MIWNQSIRRIAKRITTSMSSELQFTRYLYAKDEVQLSLVLSILNKDDDALFWACELFHSGFDLVGLMWSIYYDFFATLNPSFEKYLSVKMKNGINDCIGTIVSNFTIRPHNMDVFMLRTIVSQFEFDNEADLDAMLRADDYLAITKVIYDCKTDDELLSVYKCAKSYFEGVGVKINTMKNQKIVLLSRIVHCYSKLKKAKMGKNLYVESISVTQYNTLNANLEPHPNNILRNALPARKILSSVGLRDINDTISLFKLCRDSSDIKDAYLNNWLYHASLSPVWIERIESFKGSIKCKQVTFLNDDCEELFYEHFGLEPDEQKKEIQQKSIRELSIKKDWTVFYKEHNQRGVVGIDVGFIREIDKVDLLEQDI